MKQFTALLLFVGLFQLTYAQNRVVTTGVPFLNIAPDARSAALGDQGVATSADAFSNHWNPAKFAFVEDEVERISTERCGLRYTPAPPPPRPSCKKLKHLNKGNVILGFESRQSALGGVGPVDRPQISLD